MGLGLDYGEHDIVAISDALAQRPVMAVVKFSVHHLGYPLLFHFFVSMLCVMYQPFFLDRSSPGIYNALFYVICRSPGAGILMFSTHGEYWIRYRVRNMFVGMFVEGAYAIRRYCRPFAGDVS
jgi:hypothetical protein